MNFILSVLVVGLSWAAFKSPFISLSFAMLILGLASVRRSRIKLNDIDQLILNISKAHGIAAESSPQLFAELRQIVLMEQNLSRQLPVMAEKIDRVMVAFWSELASFATIEQRITAARELRKSWPQRCGMASSPALEDLRLANQMWVSAETEASKLRTV